MILTRRCHVPRTGRYHRGNIKTHRGKIQKLLGTIIDSIFFQGWTKLRNIVGEVKDPNAFQRRVILRTRFPPINSLGWIQARYWGRTFLSRVISFCMSNEITYGNKNLWDKIFFYSTFIHRSYEITSFLLHAKTFSSKIKLLERCFQNYCLILGWIQHVIILLHYSWNSRHVLQVRAKKKELKISVTLIRMQTPPGIFLIMIILLIIIFDFTFVERSGA